MMTEKCKHHLDDIFSVYMLCFKEIFVIRMYSILIILRKHLWYIYNIELMQLF